MPVPSTVADLDATAANNFPSGSESIGTNLDDYLRSHAAIIKQVSNAKVSAGVATSSGLTVSATDKILGRSTAGAGAIEEIACTAAGRAILDDADASAQRTTLGLGTLATQSATIGTSANNLVQLDGSAKLPAVDGSQVTNVAVNANSQASSYTLVLSDNAKSIDFTGSTGQTITIPANASVAFPVGSTVTITNTTANSLSIAITTDTLRQAGTANTGTRTLAQYGVATARKVASTTWIISGAGLS